MANRIKPFIYTHKTKEGGQDGIKIHCLLKSEAKRLSLDNTQGRNGIGNGVFTSWRGKSFYTIKVYLQESTTTGSNPLFVSIPFIKQSDHQDVSTRIVVVVNTIERGSSSVDPAKAEKEILPHPHH